MTNDNSLKLLDQKSYQKHGEPALLGPLLVPGAFVFDFLVLSFAASFHT